MGFLSKPAKSVVSVAVLPVDIFVDAVTLGGALTDKEEPHTVERIKKIAKSTDEAIDDLGEGDIL